MGVLKQKGYGALPCPVTATNSAAMQRQLIKIKQEKVESLVDDERLLMDTSDANLSSSSNISLSKRVSFSLPNGIVIQSSGGEEDTTKSEINTKKSELNSKKSEISKLGEISKKNSETPRKGSDNNMKKSETPRKGSDLNTKGSDMSRPPTLDEILRKYQFTTGGPS